MILQSPSTADDLVMEEREELMVSPTGSHVSLRKAHFLVPCVTSIDGPVAAPSVDSLISSATSCGAKYYTGLAFKVDLSGWRQPKQNWKTWVDQMLSLHRSTWKKAGIFDAIVNSTCNIHRYDDLVLVLVEKWCPSTNSFVFPWGEATMTLEDMMVLGGYSVLGKSVLSPPGDAEMEEIVNKLLRARSNIIKTKAKKADQSQWLTKFMGSGSEIEHEAFLAYWLSRFVFPLWHQTIGRTVLPIAVHMARGTKIALAPSVLASIYKSLTLLKAGIIAARKSGTKEGKNDVFKVTVSAPLALVQVESELDEDLEGFVRCLRTSELVSLETDCIEQYLPHRVALQFGMDQDLPGHVARVNVNPEIAWRDYCRPIGDVKLYVPPRLYDPQVTSRYLKWWKKLSNGWSDQPGAADHTCEGSKVEEKQELFDFVPPPPGFSPKWKKVEAGDSGISEHRTNNANLQALSSTANYNLGSSKSSKRKFAESSSSEYNARCVSSPRVTRKAIAGEIYDDQGRNHSSSTANDGALSAKPPESQAKCTLTKEASQGLDNKIGVSPIQVESSTPGIGLEERIRNIEKLFAWFKAGKLVCL
ncbi:hypothetical protein DH2020_041681 [Rehmannia glutinosa]|uniref:Aminotransferase-like plant mobile domain-containing protein n=1 Tax=Rehmannia glutinosa TaxID=99300 RepID=A0ABR0URJ4_REHGL